MNITLPIKSNSDYSNRIYIPLAFVAHRLVPAVSLLMSRSLREKLYNFLASKEESIATIRRNTGDYPARTWYGLNGIDQYDLWADCTHAVSRNL
jgi:hypothetical protein